MGLTPWPGALELRADISSLRLTLFSVLSVISNNVTASLASIHQSRKKALLTQIKQKYHLCLAGQGSTHRPQSSKQGYRGGKQLGAAPQKHDGRGLERAFCMKGFLVSGL